MFGKCYVRTLGVASHVLLALPAIADEQRDWGLFVGAGALVAPEFLGSSDYSALPALIGTLQKGPFYIKLTGTQITANVLPFESVYAGPLVAYGGGRKDLSDSILKKLPEVDEELWLGGAFGAGYDGLMLERDSIGASFEIAHDVMGDSGTTATFGLGYEVNATERLAFGLDLSTTYVDGKHADAYYSVTASGAAASGLSQYSADSGFRDLSLDVSARYAFSESWGVGALAGGSVLLGEFADSPIVKERGQAESGRAGLFVWYRY
ncbi:MipA/OmpV family protein [Roseibium sp.]|uniref:MipA/OmpV family protein n=1 Tax=Roseibium sp. TaxID=1936156 RepID=UPI003A97843D